AHCRLDWLGCRQRAPEIAEIVARWNHFNVEYEISLRRNRILACQRGEDGMAVRSAWTRGVRTLARREFWTFKVIHAVLGGLLTVSGACSGIFLTEQIRKQVAGVDGTIAENQQRVESIERALTQFQSMQAQGILF